MATSKIIVDGRFEAILEENVVIQENLQASLLLYVTMT